MRGQPLLGQAALQEGDAGRDVGEPVHPTGNVLPGQDLTQRPGKVVAVSVHQVVPVAPEFFAELFQDLVDVCGPEIGEAEMHRLLEPELLAEFSGLPGCNVKNSGKGERVASVSVLPAVNFESGMVNTETDVSGVVVGPEHVVDVENDGLASSVVVVGDAAVRDQGVPRLVEVGLHCGDALHG